MARKKRNPANQELMKYLFENYEITTALDIQEALKDMFAGTLENMLTAELDDHLGYDKHETEQETLNRRNGTSVKTVQSQLGEFEIKVPRDRASSFTPKVVKKHQKDISGLEERILSLYAKGQSQRDIMATVYDIYGIDLSHETISKITDKVIPMVHEFRSRPLKSFYTFVFVDAMFVPVKTEVGSSQKALYNMIGIDIDGHKEVLGFWLAEEESSRQWLKILEEIQSRGVKDILVISLDGLPGLENAIKTTYPQTQTQRCIVHLLRSATRYIPRKKWAEFAKDAKEIYKAISLDEAKFIFESFQQKWADYQSAVNVWTTNWESISQLFEFPAEIRKIIYTTNAIESYHSQLRKVTQRKGSFPSEMALFKLLYMRISEICQVWNRPIQNWPNVLNKLAILYEERITQFL